MSVFQPYIARWQLEPDGEAIVTHSSELLPVRWRGQAAMLKVAHEKDERLGGVLMRWWAGEGAARVLAWEGDGLLIERAQGPRSLAGMVREGQDDEATRILCDAAARLHAPRASPPPELIPLEDWFRDLWAAPAKYGGLFGASARTARALLDDPQDVRVLHGDVHHGNVLDFGARGWLAIDPKCLQGERGFDYANIFCNPDREGAQAPGRFARRLERVAEAAGIERRRLLQWLLAWAGLSAAWIFDDSEADEDDRAQIDLAVMAMAAQALDEA